MANSGETTTVPHLDAVGVPTVHSAPVGAGVGKVIEYRCDIDVIVLRGDLDLTVERSLRDLLVSSTKAIAVLDLTAVDLLSASCLGVVLGEAAERQRRRRAIALVADHGCALRILQVTGTGTWIPVFESLADALREVGAWAGPAPAEAR